MVKSIIYFGATCIGLLAGLTNPLIAMVVYIQLYFVDPTYIARDISGFRYQLAAAVVLLISIGIHRPKGVLPVGKEGRLVKALLWYGALAIVSCLWAIGDSAYGFLYAREFCKTILIAALIPLVIRNERDLKILMLACLIGVGHSAFMQTSGIHHLDWVSGKHKSYILTDRTGSVFMLFLPIIVLVAMYGTKWERVLCWCSLPFVLDALVRTGHRAYFVALAAEVVLLLVFLPSRLRNRLLPAIAVAVVLFVFVLTPQNYWSWMSTLKNPTTESSAASRFVINRISLKMLAKYPWGVGYRNYSDGFRQMKPAGMKDKRAHNTFFSVACETGVQGFAVWAFAVGGALIMLRRIRKQTDLRNPSRVGIYATGMEFGIYGALIGDCFHSGYETDPLYWFVALTVVLTRLHVWSQREEVLEEEELESQHPVTVAGVT